MENTTIDYTSMVSTFFEDFNDSSLTTTSATKQASSGGGPPPVGYYGEMRVKLWKYIPAIIIVWGTIGNVLTVLVLIRQRKMSSTATFLLTLALSDIIILYCGPLRNWIKQIWDIDVRLLSEAGCKIQLYLTYSSIQYSSWLLITVTWERVMSVLQPHKVRLFCTTKRAVLTVCILLVFILGFNMVIPIIMKLDGHKSATCSPGTEAHLKFRDDIYQWMDFTMAFALPFILLLIGNVIIIVQLHRSRRNQRQMSVSNHQNGNTTRDTRSVSVLMICLCVIFFVTMTPVTCYQIYASIKMDEIYDLYKTDPIKAWYDYQYLLFVRDVLSLVGYTNAAFNFLLYVFSGAKFRNELIAMVCFRRSPGGVAFGSKYTMSTSSGKKKTASSKVRDSGIDLADDKDNDHDKAYISNIQIIEKHKSLTEDFCVSENTFNKEEQ